MKILRISILLLAMSIAGCAGFSYKSRMDNFAVTVENYGTAIHWSNFEDAAYYIKDPKKEVDLSDLKNLEQIKVTSYEVKKISVSKEGLKVRQVVQIRYYRTDTLIEKTLTDDQLWEYDEADKRWHIQSLPDFK